MKQSSTPRLSVIRPLLPSARVALHLSLGLGLLAVPLAVCAQDATPASQTQAAPGSSQQPAAQGSIAISNEKQPKAKERKQSEKIVTSKDSKKADKKSAKTITLAGKDTKLPDKALFDKAQDAIQHGRYDVGRIDLQTLLNTYPESQYMMQSKLAIADSWFKEGGTAALTQAEQEYKDFITFFPNAPEAAEAQMRVGDIYFKQMDKPDRDYTKTQEAEAEYRLMLQQFPDSPLIPQAKQKLREVQETLALRDANIAEFYASRQNASAAIARFQTVVDSYPLYSQLDEVLIGMGDQYEAMAHNVRLTPSCSAAHPNVRCLPEDAKGRLLQAYDGDAQAAYNKVVLEHSASAHVEDAKDRLVGMNLPVPTPTAEEVAASTALENSRGQYTLTNRAIMFFAHQADTVPAATIGEPALEDPKATVAPDVNRKAQQDIIDALNPEAAKQRAAAALANATPAAGEAAAAQPAAASGASAAPLSLENVPTATAGDVPSSAVDPSVGEASPSTRSTRGTGVGVEIVQPTGNQPAPTKPGNTAFPGTQPAATSDPAGQSAAPNPADNGLGAASQPAAKAQLAPVEHADKAPDAVNEVQASSQPQQTQTAAANGKKNPKPAYDSGQESSSKHKPKKGLKKLNPF